MRRVAPLDGFSTVRPIVVEEVSKGNIAFGEWRYAVRYASGRGAIVFVTHMLVPTDRF